MLCFPKNDFRKGFTWYKSTNLRLNISGEAQRKAHTPAFL